MAVYSIKEIEKLSGIKAHTLRIWEKRYTLISPHRTNTNIRYYTDEELRKILNVAVLNRQGIKISNIAKLSDQELGEEIVRISRNSHRYETLVDSLVIAMIELDDYKLENLIEKSIAGNGLKNTVLEVLYPFLDKVGILWQSGNIYPAQEHLVSYLIRQKIIAAIDRLPSNPDPGAKRFLLLLPEGEWHEITLLFGQYLLKEAGHKVLYLGQSVPYSDILATGTSLNFDYIILSSTILKSKFDFTLFLQDLCGAFPDKKILSYTSSRNVEPENLPSNHIRLNSVEDLNFFLAGL